MTDNHITDNEIQQYVLDRTNCRTYVIDHISSCTTCGAHADVYRLIFSNIRQQAKPDFDFDPNGLVVESIFHGQAAVSMSRRLTWISILIGLSVIGGTIYLFGKHLAHVFAGVSRIGLYLIVVTAALLLLLQGIEMFRKHKKQMAALDLN